ncbi:aldo/keto reductase [Leucobacter sp. M11]|uniref:aldo/keto reductase n=1 Tax=Leucobacter sp. M11 TaxID=2993565 RepID=UPI002D7F6880|nr:aldo/keto reductase [Leucobacter sp. M11]MEB4614054.1 aldo/keto reductase [Leucobacter sp. M11]
MSEKSPARISPDRSPLGTSGMEVCGIGLGGNVFGWTADEPSSHRILDAYADAGGNLIDTADGYSHWVPGNAGGESESVIGSWLRGRGRRERVLIASKVSTKPDRAGLAPANIRAAAEDSLARLGVDAIDLYYAHFDDPETPLEETVAAFAELVTAGKIRAIGLSNYTPERLSAWFDIAEREGHPLPVALQPHYNLMEREYETGARQIAEQHGLAVFPYFGLAGGFLTGKYRVEEQARSGPPGDGVPSQRAERASRYLSDSGRAVLSALDEISARHGVPVASAALAWLRQQDTVAAPLASARTPEQLDALIRSTTVTLSPAELEQLSGATA